VSLKKVLVAAPKKVLVTCRILKLPRKDRFLFRFLIVRVKFRMADTSYGSLYDGYDEEILISPLSVHIEGSIPNIKPWEFPGWGKHITDKADPMELKLIQDKISVEYKKLGTWSATAICGNDIMSSCLYTSGIVAVKAGKLAPVALAIVAALLYLYRFIYGEVVRIYIIFLS